MLCLLATLSRRIALDFRHELCYTIHNTLTKKMTAMSDNPRRLYDNRFGGFRREDENAILGLLCDHYHGDARTTTREAWKGEISIMRELVSLLDHAGRIIFEYDIPRLGKRIDVVLLLRGIIFCLEYSICCFL